MAQQTNDEFTLPSVNLVKACLFGWATYWLAFEGRYYYPLLPLGGVWTGYHTVKQVLSAVINAQSIQEHDGKIKKFRKQMEQLSTSAIAKFADLAGSEHFSLQSGVYLGMLADAKGVMRRVFAAGRYHISVIAPPGMNKTMAIVVPTILQWTWKKGHLLINDPSGEILSICAPHLRSQRFEILVVSPFMHEINRLIGAKTPWVDAKVDFYSALSQPGLDASQVRPLMMEVSEWLIPEQPNTTDSDYFPEEARSLATWLAMHDWVQGYQPCLVSMRRTLMQGPIKLKELLHEAADQTEHFGGVYAEVAATNYGIAEDAAPQFMGGIGTLKVVLDKYDSHSELGQHVIGPEYNLNDLRDPNKRFAIIVCYPPDKVVKFPKQHAMTFSYFMDSIASINSKVPTTAILDEVGAMKFPLADKLNLYRKFGSLRCMMVWQDLSGQARKNHGEAQTNSIMAASHMKVLIGVTDPQALKMAEEACGTEMVAQASLNNTQGDKSKLIHLGSGQSMQQRPVLSAAEIRQLLADELLVIVGNDKPVVLTKTSYWLLPDLLKKAGPSPYHLEDDDA